KAFAGKLLGEMTPEVLIYLQEKDPNFFFQLSPDVWKALPDDTVKSVLAYLAGKTSESSGNKGALQQLIDQEIVPQLEALPVVARVSTSGGQAPPGEETANAPISNTQAAPTSLLLQLSPDAWAAASVKASYQGALDEKAVDALKGTAVDAPTTPPAL